MAPMMQRDQGPDPRQVYLDILAAAMLLTRIPVEWPDDEQPDTARSYWAFGLVGLGVAALPAILAAVLVNLGAPVLAAAALALGLIALLTGGLHLDGLADIADSLGGRNPEHRLKIMHDSSIGSFGTVALILVSLISLSCLMHLGEQSAELMAGGLLASATLSRAMMGVQRFLHETPGPQGLASVTGQPSLTIMAIGVLLSLVVTILFAGGSSAIAMLIAGLVLTFGLGAFLRNWVGGVNGDGLGATQQLSEAAMLLTLTLMAG